VGLGRQVEDAAGVAVEPPAGVGQRHPPGRAAEEGHPQAGFEPLDPLADGALGEAEVAGGRGEAVTSVRPS
jgi:hypothetical protein